MAKRKGRAERWLEQSWASRGMHEALKAGLHTWQRELRCPLIGGPRVCVQAFHAGEGRRVLCD